MFILCISNIPCNCAISAGRLRLPPLITDCVHHTHVTKVYPVNLVVLANFFEYNAFRNILADTTFQQPLNVSLPPFKIYQHNFSEVIASDDTIHLNLKCIAARAKANEVIYTILSDPIVNGEHYTSTPANPFQWTFILLALPTCVSVVSLSISVFL